MTIAKDTFCGLSDKEVELFQKVLRGATGEAIEIGCLDGFSTAILLECSCLNLTSIDPFIPDSMSANLIGSKDRLNANIHPWRDRHHLIEDYSWNARLHWTKPINLLFIDGDHKYENVLRDFLDWTPLLKQGGILAMHDSRMSRLGGARFHAGPSNVAEKYVYAKPSQWDIVGEAFSLTVAKKK